MRSRTNIIFIVIAVLAIGVSVLTIHPVARQTEATQPSTSTNKPHSTVKKPAKNQTQRPRKAAVKPKPAKKTAVATQTVGGYTLTKRAVDLPTGLANGQATNEWSSPITLTLSTSALASGSDGNLVRFDGLQVGQSYRLWVQPSGSDQAYEINYQPTSASQYVPTPLLRTVYEAAQKTSPDVSQLTIYNSRRVN
ncbi:hypothetical protein [Furfurilactobacillus curtus]|uniref:Uncharacterized protein n=1 Tax=Furfurilactobacillus curtus TaxID=1746200 RepID=A0ABQ5JRX0_9LACO